MRFMRTGAWLPKTVLHAFDRLLGLALLSSVVRVVANLTHDASASHLWSDSWTSALYAPDEIDNEENEQNENHSSNPDVYAARRSFPQPSALRNERGNARQSRCGVGVPEDGGKPVKRLAMDDDAVLAAVDRVQQAARPVDALRVAVELGEPDEEDAVDETLQRLADEGRLLHESVFVEFATVPGNRSRVDFYRLPA
jgi:hypothetical protein